MPPWRVEAIFTQLIGKKFLQRLAALIASKSLYRIGLRMHDCADF